MVLYVVMSVMYCMWAVRWWTEPLRWCVFWGGFMPSGHTSLMVTVVLHPIFLSFPPHCSPLLLSSPLLTLGCMETWMTSQCGSAAREGKSLGYSGLTRRRAGYADFSRSLHQQWGMALMQSKLPPPYGFQYITSFNQLGKLEHDVVWSVSREINLLKLHWSALSLFCTSVYYLWQAILKPQTLC